MGKQSRLNQVTGETGDRQIRQQDVKTTTNLM